jgi:DtxR family Mn-dependent transcriptional regulator
MYTQSEENYIKAIYALGGHTHEAISTNLLAAKLQTKPSSVTDMLKKLTDKEIVSYTKYQGCVLTEKGKKIALSIIRKHRLWEVFLVDKLNFGWEEVHEIAEQLEHIQSSNLTDKLDEFLNFPDFDPHGDPIPTANGDYRINQKRTLLSNCSEGQAGIIMGVEDGQIDFLQYLNQIKLRIGSKIEVKSILQFDQSMQIQLDGQLHQFSQIVASKIAIKLEK